MMASFKFSALRWGTLFVCLIIGTWFGIFMQRFGATRAVFANFVDFAVDIRQIDLVMLKFGFLFALKLNLGTITGGFAGVLFARPR